MDDLGRHTRDIGFEIPQGGLEIGRTHHHVDEAHLVLARNARADELETERFDAREVLETDRASPARRVDEQDLHAAHPTSSEGSFCTHSTELRSVSSSGRVSKPSSRRASEASKYQ